MAVGMLFLGMACGIIIGMQYIPYQLKKKNPKVIKQIRYLLEQCKK